MYPQAIKTDQRTLQSSVTASGQNPSKDLRWCKSESCRESGMEGGLHKAYIVGSQQRMSAITAPTFSGRREQYDHNVRE